MFFKLNCPKCEIFKKLLTTLCAASVTILTLHCRRGLQLHAPVTYTLSCVLEPCFVPMLNLGIALKEMDLELIHCHQENL